MVLSGSNLVLSPTSIPTLSSKYTQNSSTDQMIAESISLVSNTLPADSETKSCRSLLLISSQIRETCLDSALQSSHTSANSLKTTAGAGLANSMETIIVFGASTKANDPKKKNMQTVERELQDHN